MIFLRSFGGGIGANLLEGNHNVALASPLVRGKWANKHSFRRSLTRGIHITARSRHLCPSIRVQQILGRALQEAFVLLGLVAALALLVALFLPKGKGISSRREEQSESPLHRALVREDMGDLTGGFVRNSMSTLLTCTGTSSWTRCIQAGRRELGAVAADATTIEARKGGRK